MEEARAALDKEIDLIKLVQSKRYFHWALKHLLDPPIRKELKQRSKLVSLDSDRKKAAQTALAARGANMSRQSSVANDATSDLSISQS